MKVIIEFEPFEEAADPDHELGLTEEAHLAISDGLASWGDILEIRAEKP